MKTKIPSNYINSFSEQLRKLLKDNHLTQQQLADSVGVSLNAVNDWINGNSQPKWLLQLFGTMEFLYENVDDFSPIQLFYDGNYPNDPLQTAMEKRFEQSARAKLEQEYKDKLAQEVKRIENETAKKIQKIKGKYQVYEIDRLREQIKRLEKGLTATPFGRQDYTQYKEKLDKKYDKLKQEFAEYKESYNALSLAELSEEDFEILSKALAYQNIIGYGKMRTRKVLLDKEFIGLLSKVFDDALYSYEREPNYEEMGKRLFDVINKTISGDLESKTRAYKK